MKTIYIDCGMGAAGDMLTAALLDLLDEDAKKAFVEKLNKLGIPGLNFELSRTSKCGIVGSHVSVKIYGEEEKVVDFGDERHDDHDSQHTHEHDHDHHHEHDHEHDHYHNHDHHHEHHHYSLSDVHAVIDGFDTSDAVKENTKNIYGIIADAESKAHGSKVEEIHFHEVGSLDAITDVTAVCILMEMLGAKKIIVSPVHVGAGKVRCAHGVLPVPTPATANILAGVPIYGGRIQSELCTPTGAALLKYFADDFGDMPRMRVEKIGYGMGNKDFEVANCVRVMLGTTDEIGDSVLELSFNVDDMTGEEIGFAMEELLTGGALDVFATPVMMKKSRPGQMITVICKPESKDEMVALIMKHTTTLGVREKLCNRSVLSRSITAVDTEFGPIRVKTSEGFGIVKAKAEYEDIAKIARENEMSLREVRKKTGL